MNDIDRTFGILKRSTYTELQKEMLSKCSYLYEKDLLDGIIFWADGAEEIIKKHNWTKRELISYIERPDNKP